MKRIIMPFATLMQRLKLAQKLALIGLIPAVYTGALFLWLDEPVSGFFVIFSVMLAVLMFMLLAGFHASHMRSVQNLKDVSADLISGNLDVRAQLDTQDEMKQIESAYNELIDWFKLMVKEQESKENEVKKLAYYDTLTGLPNRMLFYDRLNISLAYANRNQKQLAVIFIDLDNFKRINDTLGHRAGDELLQAVANRFTSLLRKSDTVARMGGDEFLLILPDFRQEDSEKVIYKLMDELAKPYLIEGRELFVTASLGISIYPTDATDADTLVLLADRAMYEVKGDGKNNFRNYSNEMDIINRDRLEIEMLMRKGIEANEFVVYHQPVVEIETGEVIGTEALVRWIHPSLGLLAADRFLPIAEETGLIVPIDLLVLEKACQDAQRMHDAGKKEWTVAVNLSTRLLQLSYLVTHIEGILQLTGYRPDRLILEFNGNRLTMDDSITNQTLEELRKRGIRISIDKFGTGVSSLEHLKRIPFDQLKIDREFIKDIPHRQKDTAITASLVTLAHNLSMKVIAIGVEENSQLEFLKRLRCDAYQGVLFSAPVPMGRMMKLIRKSEYL